MVARCIDRGRCLLLGVDRTWIWRAKCRGVPSRVLRTVIASKGQRSSAHVPQAFVRTTLVEGAAETQIVNRNDASAGAFRQVKERSRVSDQ